jgi:pimeloyl-ACP methyl ester carboxylesterase
MRAYNHQYATVNGVKLHYVLEGEGEQLVVLLHGWPEFWYSWRNQIEALRPHYQVVALDMRGFNKSEKPREVAAYTQEIVGRDVVELVHYLGYGQAAIIGHDWGGAIAWHIALNYPESVCKLIIMNCPHPAIFIHHLKSNPGQLLRSWYMFFFQIPGLPEFLISLDLKRFFSRAMRDWAVNKSNFTDEVIEKYAEAYSRKGAVRGGINYYRANIRAVRSIQRSRGRKVQAPTLMIWGEDDKALGKELTNDTGRYINNTFRLHFIPHCGHWVQNDCPEEVNSAVLDFLHDADR